ncbi:MAG: AraC family transcriptional regulator, partial [Epulopiscium sp.]|nr:AraC family transcriptional regulator [Candidatus Epulonipiscium sp.]
GLLDFINQTRIEAAKDILKGPEKKKLEDVATAVGYGNVRTFMRIFKSYEGVTPGQYMNL